MRFLKKKVQLSETWYDQNPQDIKVKLEPETPHSTAHNSNSPSSVDSEDSPIEYEEVLLTSRKKKQTKINPDGNSKNIVKNYGKALIMFALSKMAVMYLNRAIDHKGYAGGVTIEGFKKYYEQRRKNIGTIESLRKLLVPEENDNEEILKYKELFKETSIIFLKYFCVNWIYKGRLMHKREHLKYRMRVLRRVQNPELFTYLRS